MVTNDSRDVAVKSLIERKIKEVFNAYLRPDSAGLYNPETISILDSFAIRLNAKRHKKDIRATKVSNGSYRLRFEVGDISFANKDARPQYEDELGPIEVDMMDVMLMELI